MLRGIFEFKTLSYQYSFIKKSNPIMSNCSNMMFIFSMYFFPIFNNFYSKPLETKITGYIYSSLINLYQDKEKLLKKKFGIKPKQIVISYFDENCSQSNWSLSTIGEMENILKFVNSS